MIHNIRLGHACNSSSSHSIVPLAAIGRQTDDYTPGDFGWDFFVLASEEAKMEYLATQLKDRLAPVWIESLTGTVAEDDWYVDHQSWLELPRSGDFRDEFLRDLAEYLRRPDVAIVGGNDNGGPDLGIGLPFSQVTRARPGRTPDGTKYWTIMQSDRGHKIRFSFETQPLSGPGDEDIGVGPVVAERPVIPYADAPELVDLKVTQFCPFAKDCPWCYMDSTTKGSHADLNVALDYLHRIAEQKVFEIALGGGEPTLWPHLGTFVDEAEKLGVNVNMTTKNMTWLTQAVSGSVSAGAAHSPRLVAGKLKAIAVSINNDRDFDRFAQIDSNLGTELTLQCVPAFCSDQLIERIVEHAEESWKRVTFLGVKRTGRGREEKRVDDLRWVDALKGKSQYWLEHHVAIDTLMAQAAKPLFDELEVDPIWYDTVEGKFSCYIDAVENKLGQSSYVEHDELFDYGPKDDLGKAFRHMQREAGIRQ